MAFLIRTIDQTAAGREIVRESELAQDSITIGRASENDIHLPDLAVEQRHVTIETLPDGTLRAAAIGTLGFAVDRRTVQSAEIDPDTGAELKLGSAILAIDRAENGATRITIRQAPQPETDSDLTRRFALASTLPGNRSMAYGLAAAILLALLAIPIVTHLTRERVEPSVEHSGQVLLDASWNTGPLSLAHKDLKDNCEACHVDPFVSVRDETCMGCHEDIGTHAPDPRIAGGRPPFEPGEALQWSVAAIFNKEGPGSCTACHTEHEGPTRLKPAVDQFCSDCHATLDTRLEDTELGNASDFARLHPQFRPAVFTRLRQEQAERISLSENPREMSGLQFPHDIHLDPQGGPARMAITLPRKQGYGEPLTCSNCHTRDDDGIGFAPVEMETACASCHSLVFDRAGNQAGSGFRSLPHGDVAKLHDRLRNWERAPRRPLVTGRKRPGQFGRGGLYHSDFGRPRPALIGVESALGPSGVCRECHLPATSNGRPDLVPVSLSDRFLMHGFFSHETHEDEECSTCHAADTSGSATDLLLPGVAVCRDCHMDESLAQAEAPATCSTCHSYHQPTLPAPIDPHGKRRDIVAILNRLQR